MKIKNIFFLSFMSLYFPYIVTNPASLDTSFAGTGYATIPLSPSSARGVAFQVDSKVVVAGNGPTGLLLARFNNDGSIDTSFGNGLGYVSTSFNAGIYSVGLQSDGKIIASGHLGNNLFIARYLTNGTLDTTYNSPNGYVSLLLPGMSNSRSNCMIIQPDDKVILGGWAIPSSGSFTGYYTGMTARFTTSGVLDTSYNSSSGFTSFTFAASTQTIGQGITIQPDGKIILVGRTYPNGGNQQGFITVYTSSGALDTSFNSPYGYTSGQFSSGTSPLNTQYYSVGINASGYIGITGATYINNINHIVVVRYTPNGQIDTSFNETGATKLLIGSGSYGAGIAFDISNKITITAGTTINGLNQQAVARFNQNGSLDTSLTPSGYFVADNTTDQLLEPSFGSVPIQENGKIMLAGQSSLGVFLVSRYLGGSIPFSPTQSISLYGQNSNLIINFLPVSFYAGVITDTMAQTAAIASVNGIIASYGVDYINQTDFNYISYLYLVTSELKQAQADLIFTYPNATTEINLFFTYITKQIANLAV